MASNSLNELASQVYGAGSFAGLHQVHLRGMGGAVSLCDLVVPPAPAVVSARPHRHSQSDETMAGLLRAWLAEGSRSKAAARGSAATTYRS